MKLEDQVCSLLLAKRLKELGIKQISIFCWSETETVPKGRDYRLYYRGENAGGNSLDYSAFTVAELGEILKPIRFKIGEKIGDKYHQYISLKCSLFSIWLEHLYDAGFSERHETIIAFNHETEANARAKMLVYLIEQGLMKP